MREIKQIKCSECQNTYYDDQDTCPFCGHKTRVSTFDTETKTETLESNPNNSQSEAKKNNQLSEQDIIILVVLAIVFWPAALIFLLVKLKK
ncbi:hypothetical protein N7603_07715 [Acholeplasma vituli]|uniref:Uncharacterized protein n=1 Tax=Paracholeplasma vituli TaxID=69473 RepID=A0ABT2PYW3_9MOLU|nr:hypothetical protein [Paracholeplasma vituli]MCU0105544.1 hypothetical protein [Paracholeplasma vituli]